MHTDKQVKNAEKCFGKNSSLVTFLSIALIVNVLWRDELPAGLVTFGFLCRWCDELKLQLVTP